jgi:hypothetical protein
MADRCRSGGRRLCDDQFDVDAELHAPVAIVGVQQFPAWVQRQPGFAIAIVRSAVLVWIAGLIVGFAVVAGIRGITIARGWLQRWFLGWRDTAAPGLAEPGRAEQCRRAGQYGHTGHDDGTVRYERWPGDGGWTGLAG